MILLVAHIITVINAVSAALTTPWHHIID